MKIQNIWFDPPHVRWGRVVATAALVFAPLLAWMAHERGLWPGEDSADRTRVVLSPPSVAASSAPATRASFRPTGAAPSRPAAARPASTSSARGSPGDVEVCGLGFVQASAMRRKPTCCCRRAEFIATGEDSMEPGAAGQRRRAWRPQDCSRPAWRSTTTARRRWPRAAPACADDTLHRSPGAGAQRGARSGQRLAARSAGAPGRRSRDPVVYALAMRRCAVGAATTCRRRRASCLLRLEQWATVDPGQRLALADAGRQIAAGDRPAWMWPKRCSASRARSNSRPTGLRCFRWRWVRNRQERRPWIACCWLSIWWVSRPPGRCHRAVFRSSARPWRLPMRTAAKPAKPSPICSRTAGCPCVPDCCAVAGPAPGLVSGARGIAARRDRCRASLPGPARPGLR